MDWENFLQRLDVTSATDIRCIPLADYRLIIVEGPDARVFLQGQCTCDFDRLTKDEILLGAHCNPKGRMSASFNAISLDEQRIALRVHTSIAEDALSALQKYAVFSKVSLSLDQDFALFGILGDPLPLLDQILGAIPAPGFFRCEVDTCLLRHSAHQLEIWCLPQRLEALAGKLDSWERDSNLWQLTNIRRGIAEVHTGVRELLIPQEMNMQLVDGVAFDKGCYTGQEIIARLHYRGQLKKHMYRATAKISELPLPGTTIYEDTPTSRSRGMVINAAWSDTPGHCEILALADDTLTQSNACVIETAPSANIVWLSLPYAIT